jgi:hypothetical protein
MPYAFVSDSNLMREAVTFVHPAITAERSDD